MVAASLIVSGKDQDGLQKLHIDDFIGNWFPKSTFHNIELNNTSKLVQSDLKRNAQYIYILKGGTEMC